MKWHLNIHFTYFRPKITRNYHTARLIFIVLHRTYKVIEVGLAKALSFKLGFEPAITANHGKLNITLAIALTIKLFLNYFDQSDFNLTGKKL